LRADRFGLENPFIDMDGLKDYGLDFLVWTIIFPIELMSKGLFFRLSADGA